MTIPISFTGPTGLNAFFSIQRLSDNFYRAFNAETFSSAPSAPLKLTALTEGSAENLGSYSGVVECSGWSDSLYQLRIHDSGSSNRTIGGSIFNIVGGRDASINDVPSFYYMDIQYMADSISGTDNWTAIFFKNSAITTATTPGIQILKYSDGSILTSGLMTQIGSSSAYKFTTSTRISDGAPVVALVSGVVDGSYRSWSRACGRDE